MIHQYQILGRRIPDEKDPSPQIYRMKIFAANKVAAKSRFWYFLNKLKKIKKSRGQILSINEIFEKKPLKIKNFAIYLRYRSRTGVHNMYKEFRDLKMTGAVQQMYSEMASRHRVPKGYIQIIDVKEIPPAKCRRAHVQQFHDSKIKFPMVNRTIKVPKNKRKLFHTRKPII
ncbi:60S ribosomal protein L18A [Anaeramoeba ignava]|uniref:60S ribosomal protein L18a n=1 Tax=Anaeramoeba ignava TaxID=1746090 RepID=A0A9Q0RES2_ANAIG|nr:60S ribosomal protein L18A [Anaeramoeba ignava]|eukprot:Anaeramoba_ignava/a1372_86.p2 GENE.a1372_86~~a1372_86.p2  ORF type:complete len:172 (+),score=44.75 a1372_86:33-548(+)